MRALRLALLLSVLAAPAAFAQSLAGGAGGSNGSPSGVPSTTPGTVAASAAYAIGPDGTYIGGAQGDAPWSGTGNGSLTAINKAMWGLLNGGLKVTPQGTTTVSVSNFPATQPVSGAVSVSNFPATQPVSGTVTDVGLGVTTAQSGAATSATAGTFTVALAASGTRKGCSIQNTSSTVEYLFLGTTASATTANSFQVAAGGTFNCASPAGTIAQDAVNIAAPGASAAYILAAQ